MSVVKSATRISWVFLRRTPRAVFPAPIPRYTASQFHRDLSTGVHRQREAVTSQAHGTTTPNSRPSNRSSSAHESSNQAQPSEYESRRITRKMKRLPRDKQRAFFKELQKSGRADVYHYSTMLSSCSSSAQAQELMREMSRVGVKPNLVTYNTLIQKHNRDGQVDLAKQVLEEMIANDVSPDVVTFSAIIDGLSRNLKHRDAMRAWRQLQQTGMQLDLFSYNIAVNMFCRANRGRKAREIIAQMTAAGIPPSTSTFTPLILMHGRRSQPEKAMGVLKEMQKLGLEIDTRAYNAVVSALATNGQVDAAEELVKEMQAAGAEQSNPASTTRGVGSRRGSQGQGEGATPADNGTLAALIEGYGRRGDMSSVLDTRARMEADGVRADVHVYTALIHVFCINGMLDEAVEAFEEMEAKGVAPTAVTFGAMIDGFALSGDRLGAMQWLWEARRRGLPPFASYMERDDAAGVVKADLHGMSALSALVAVEFALSFQPRSLHEKVVVVTGQGRHSRGRRAVVKPVIEGFLAEEGIRFASADGNEGRLELVPTTALLPSLVFCCLLLAIMWMLGVVMARDWLERVQKMNERTAHVRNVERLREELRRGLAEHAGGRKSIGELAVFVEEIEREWRAAEAAEEALRTPPRRAARRDRGVAEAAPSAQPESDAPQRR